MNPYRNINIAKGIGIFLVVFGHYEGAGGYSSEAFNLIRDFIYTFHMPLFMFLSGFLFAKTFPLTDNYLSFVKKKASRLLIPYVSITILLFAIKYITGIFVPLKFPIYFDSLLYSIFVTPMGGFATFLWYIYALFVIFLIVPLFKNLKILLLFSFIIYFIPMPEIFCLNLVANHLIFFSLGIFIYNQIFNAFKIKRTLLISVVSSLLMVLIFVVSKMFELYRIDSLILAILGIISIYSLSLYLYDKKDKYISYMGKYSSEIYFLHTIFMGVVTVALTILDINPILKFYVGMILALLFGVVFPIVTAKILDYYNLKLFNRLLFGKTAVTIPNNKSI